MKKKLLLIVVSLIGVSVAISSCKKHKDDTATPTQFYDSVAYRLDAHNRVIGRSNFVVKDGVVSFIDGTAYQYYTDKIVATSHTYSSNNGGGVSYYLNPNGTVYYSTGTRGPISANGSTTYYDTIYYTYDTDGYNTVQTTITSFQGTSTHDTITNTFSGGNKIATRYASGKQLKYTYNSAEDKYDLFIKGDVAGLFGKKNTNLVQSYKDGNNTFSSTNEYEFNANGYITRCVTTNVASSSTTKTDCHISYSY